MIIRHHHPEMTPEQRRAAIQPVLRALEATRVTRPAPAKEKAA